MDKMPWKIERKPPITEHSCLQATRVRHGDYQNSVGCQQGCRLADALPRIRQVLKRMPNDNGGPRTVYLGKVSCAYVGPERFALQPQRLTAATFQGIEQCSVTGADIEHGAGRGNTVEASRETGAGAAQDRVTEAREPT